MATQRRSDPGDPNAPESSANINDFPGMFLNADPEDLPPGGSELQVNVNSRLHGELRSRLGYREVSFEAT